LTEGSITGMARLTGDHLRLIATVRHDEIAGVEDELVVLMDRYETPIYAYLLSILHDRDLALDCSQDTFLRAYQALSRGRAINGKWLYTVARNRATDEFRHRRQLHPDAEALEDVHAEETPTESMLDVRAVMARLPPLDREVLYLFEVAGFKTDEIGALLEIRGTAVRQRLTRARRRFRALHAAEDNESLEFRATRQ
jgi:RNA polymerase sigma factor (sigma-70 family)